MIVRYTYTYTQLLMSLAEAVLVGCCVYLQPEWSESEVEDVAEGPVAQPLEQSGHQVPLQPGLHLLDALTWKGAGVCRIVVCVGRRWSWIPSVLSSSCGLGVLVLVSSDVQRIIDLSSNGMTLDDRSPMSLTQLPHSPPFIHPNVSARWSSLCQLAQLCQLAGCQSIYMLHVYIDTLYYNITYKVFVCPCLTQV